MFLITPLHNKIFILDLSKQVLELNRGQYAIFVATARFISMNPNDKWGNDISKELVSKWSVLGNGGLSKIRLLQSFKVLWIQTKLYMELFGPVYSYL